MAVELGLERVLSEVGDYPVSVGTHPLTEPHCELADARHQVAALPKLPLGHVPRGNEHYLDGEPVEAIAKHEYVVLFVNPS